MHAVKNIEEISSNYTNIQYINSIGALIDNRLLIHSPDRIVIELDRIKKAEIHKTRNFIYNAFFLICALSLVYFLLTCNFTDLEQILISAITVLLLAVAFKIKNAKYILCIKKSDMDFIRLEINHYSKEDAKNIAKIVNKRVRQLRKK